MLGLGKMGLPMAQHLAARGFEVVGYDPARKKAGHGIQIAASAREVAQACELAIVVVGFDHEVEKALFAPGGVAEGATPGLIVGIASTIAPQYARKLAGRLKKCGVTLLDMPLARGEQAAVSGKLLVFGGGDAKAFERCRPALSTFASDIFHLGPAGAGQVGKMVNNMILWACVAANDESLRLAEALGVDRDALRKALHRSSAQNWAMDWRAEDSGMPWAEKDMAIALREADLARLSLPLSGATREVIKGLKIRMGLGMPDSGEK